MVGRVRDRSIAAAHACRRGWRVASSMPGSSSVPGSVVSAALGSPALKLGEGPPPERCTPTLPSTGSRAPGSATGLSSTAARAWT